MSPIVFCRHQGGTVDADSNCIRVDGHDGEEDRHRGLTNLFVASAKAFAHNSLAVDLKVAGLTLVGPVVSGSARSAPVEALGDSASEKVLPPQTKCSCAPANMQVI
jgi:hypothetical protein